MELQEIPGPSRTTNQVIIPFKKRKELNARKFESAMIRLRHPTKIPVVVECYAREKNLPRMDKTKFILPDHMTMAALMALLRSRMCVDDTQAVYLLINNKSFASYATVLQDIYSKHKDKDGFLYVTYASEQAFGNYH